MTVTKLFLLRALAGKPLTFHGDGSRAQSFTYCDDVAQAFIAALDGRGGIYNIAPSEPVSMRTLAAMIANLCALPPSTITASGQADPQQGICLEYDIRSAARELGWTPSTPLRDGLALFRDWLRRAET